MDAKRRWGAGEGSHTLSRSVSGSEPGESDQEALHPKAAMGGPQAQATHCGQIPGLDVCDPTKNRALSGGHGPQDLSSQPRTEVQISRPQLPALAHSQPHCTGHRDPGSPGDGGQGPAEPPTRSLNKPVPLTAEIIRRHPETSLLRL